MTSELLALLQETTLASSAAILVVLMLRRPLRAVFGAGAAYAGWLLVPAAVLGVLLPAAAEPMLPAFAVAPVVAATTAMPTAATDSLAWRDLLAPLWIAGTLLMLAVQVQRQRRFRAALGPLRRRADGLFESAAPVGLPAVLGWPARIVLPVDFEKRFDAGERELVLCHERVHLRRGDLEASALVAVLRCLFWFNPLLHFAAVRFRQDQELACDASVLRRHPNARRRYGDALLKAELAGQMLPASVHGFGAHPLKERLAMLKNPLPSTSRWIVGILTVPVLAFAAAMVAWAAQPPEAAPMPASAATSSPGNEAAPLPGGAAAAPVDTDVVLSLEVKIDGGDAQTAEATVAAGESNRFPFTSAGGEQWLLDTVMTPRADGRYRLDVSITRAGELLAKPGLVFDDSGASMALGGEPGKVTKGIEIKMNARHADPAFVPTVVTAPDRGPELPSPQAPEYPPGAAEAGQSANVVLRVLVGVDGRPLAADYNEASDVGPESPFVQMARETAMKWQFTPGMKDGEPTQAWVDVPVRFEAPKPAPAG